MFDASSLGIRALKQLLEDHYIKIPAGSEKLELVSLVPSELDFRRVRNDIARSLQVCASESDRDRKVARYKAQHHNHDDLISVASGSFTR